MIPAEPPSAEAGHVLAEAMVAVLIVAAMTALFFQTVAAKAQATRQVELRRSATMVASSRLAMAMAGGLSGGLPTEGEETGLHWSVTISPYEANARSGPVRLEQVRVSVAPQAAPGNPLVVLDSLRVEP